MIPAVFAGLLSAVDPQRFLDHRTTGMAESQVNFANSTLLETPVLVPPLLEQRCIADALDTLDTAIRTNRELIAKLRLVKQGLMQALLTRGVDRDGAIRNPDLYPEQFKRAPLGLVPRDWEVRSLGDVSSFVTSGSRGWGAYYAERGPLFLRIGNLTREHINLRLDKLVHVSPPGTEGKRTRLEAGDVLISITADLGIVGVVPTHLGEAYVNQHIALVRVDPAKANSRWVAHYLAGPKAQQWIRRLDDPGAKAGLNLPTVRSLPVGFPPKHEQDELADHLDAADAAILSEQDNLRKLLLLRVGLMDDLLTGRVSVAPLLGGVAS